MGPFKRFKKYLYSENSALSLALNWPKLTIKTFTVLQNIYFELSIQQFHRNSKKKVSQILSCAADFNFKYNTNKCLFVCF